jgi:magnesium transporter
MRKLFTVDGHVEDASHIEINRCFKDAHEKGFWLDIEAPSEEDYHLLEHTFKFHPLAIEDIKNQDQRPKIDEYTDYNFAVIFQAEWRGEEEVTFLEHHLFVGANYLITVRQDPAPAIDELQKRIKQGPELTKGMPAFLTYLVVDVLVDATFPALEKLDDTVDALEDEITSKASPDSLNRIYHLKHAVTDLRKFLGAQREVFQRLITHGIHVQQQDMTLYYRDVYDHIVRQYETVDGLRDLLTSAMDVYLSTVSNRLNKTTTTLAVIASVFLPLSFLTGFYGMNFTYLTTVLEIPYWTFWAGLATMLISIVIQLILFRRRGWI